jgi:preprotein translocase subunit SecE
MPALIAAHIYDDKKSEKCNKMLNFMNFPVKTCFTFLYKNQKFANKIFIPAKKKMFKFSISVIFVAILIKIAQSATNQFYEAVIKGVTLSCSATFIHRSHVMTATHCLRDA